MNVKEYLDSKGAPYEVLRHPHAVGAHGLARSLEVPDHDIAKTVLLRADKGYAHILAVLPGNARVDVQRVSKALAGSRLEVVGEDDVAAHCPDCEPGVLPPFGSAYDMETMVDESLATEGEIVFEGNDRTEAIRMKYEDYRRIEQPLVAKFAVPEEAHAKM